MNRNNRDILEDLYAIIIDKEDHDFPNEIVGLLKLMWTYELSEEEVSIVAFLMHCYPVPASEPCLKETIAGSNTNYRSVIRELKTRGFIEQGISMPGMGSFKLTEAAHKSLISNRPLGVLPMKDCFMELKTCSPCVIFTQTWLDAFNRNIELEQNSQFRNASNELNLHYFSKDAQFAFWYIARFFVDHFLQPLAFRVGEDILDDIPYNQNTLKENLAKLVKEGFVDTLPIEPLEDTKDTDRFVLSPKVAGLLFHGREEVLRYDEVSKYGNIIKFRDIPEKRLYFSADTQAQIDNLRKVLSKKGFTRACHILISQKRNPAVQSLFWGPPGTGKTEVVKQLARECERDIIEFDVSKVTASAWGASEKFYRAFFRAYGYLAQISVNVPIVLMNEADTALSKRLPGIERAIDKSENAISNILLQAFEDMSGILLATTNLIDNLDEAFDRRFLFKTNIERPDANARYHIWRTLLPDFDETDILVLANLYAMTGAQISNVIAKRDLAELFYEGERGLSFIEELCRIELATDKSNIRTTRKIGF